MKLYEIESLGQMSYSFLPFRFQQALWDGEINAMVEGSRFRESHVLKILS